MIKDQERNPNLMKKMKETNEQTNKKKNPRKLSFEKNQLTHKDQRSRRRRRRKEKNKEHPPLLPQTKNKKKKNKRKEKESKLLTSQIRSDFVLVEFDLHHSHFSFCFRT
jgi:hypothetical protein